MAPKVAPPDLESAAHLNEVHDRIRRKPALARFYREVYDRYRACIDQTPPGGAVLELGSGGGFAREALGDAVPELVTSDVLPYPGIDRVVDATAMPFGDGTLRAIVMLNVFHHLANAPRFLAEASRCLVTGGRVLIVDQHVGRLSRIIYRHLHHEGFEPEAADWPFESAGPLAGANGALAWIVFGRDRARLAAEYPQLELLRYQPHSPLRYWLAGGLKWWSLLPGFAYGPAIQLDRALTRLSPELASFVDIELVRR